MNSSTTPPAEEHEPERGLLIPPWYVSQRPDFFLQNMSSIIFGFSIGIALFAFAKGVRHTCNAHKRGQIFNKYILLIWAVWITSNQISVVCWLYLHGYISPR